MNDQPSGRLLVFVHQPNRTELLALASEASLLDRARAVSRTTLARLRELLGDEVAGPPPHRGAQTDAPAGKPPSRPGCGGGLRLHVLVVEDHSAVRESWCVLLGSWGHAVTAAKDGPEAVAAAAAFPPDVVLMDLGLPTMDGYETARRIRRVTDGCGPRFLALTGRGRPPDRERSRREGFACHLHKPVEPSELRDVLAAIVSCVEGEAGGPTEAAMQPSSSAD